MSIVKTRQGTLEDTLAITQVNIQAWQESYAGLIEPYFLENLLIEHRFGPFEALAKQPNSRCFVAEAEGKVVGFCHAGALQKPVPDVKGEIFTLYVLKAYHDQGVGFALWQKAVAYLEEHAWTPFQVWTLERNERARLFYERQGGELFNFQDLKIGTQLHKEVGYIFTLLQN